MKNKKLSKNVHPLVSIVIPVYNAEKYLSLAIDSILGQTYKNYEVFIVDDKSTDTSWTIAKNYQKKYPDLITAVKLPKNTNAAGNGAINHIYSQLHGTYIARMDADDIAHKERIKKQVTFMEKHRDAIIVGTQGIIIDENGDTRGTKTFPTSHKDIYNEYFILHPILHPSVMIRKSLIPTKTYLYEDIWGTNDDYYTFFKLLQYGKFYNLSAPLLYYRMHSTNTSLQNPKKKFINSIKIRLQAIKKFGYRPSVRGVVFFLGQLVIIPLLPEFLIIPLYLALRGIKQNKRNIFSLLQPKVLSPITSLYDTLIMKVAPVYKISEK